ncbi:hypothetical protein CBER1_10699 [Cercospora berteroae]|uniref:Probable glucan endo-1,3-beta-glucosidase eglC n=1 Tax=Cercospora berteroae TaxID=357750 RepID=A0A2S6BWY3_9PEZI|nr:hypothetical protein CBER1_10699 [Cercospora berteroae]
MRFSTSVAALAAAAQQGAAYYKGFNVGANNPDGSCKTREQWEEAFNKLRGLPQDINTVRLYASSDCNTLANAVPAAQNTGTQILVGVWTEDAAHFGAEKAALESAINTFGYDWILAISVGSEDLYRGDTDANTLAQQIYDVRGMVRAMGVEAEVGHVDTWNAFTDSANDPVILACDFIGLDAYPYWEGGSIEEAYDLFFKAYQATKDHVQSVGSGAWVWITETSWPVTGDNFGNAVPSVANAQKFWRSVACELFNEAHVFWYAYQDYNDSPSFGIFDSNGNAIYDLHSSTDVATSPKKSWKQQDTMAPEHNPVAPATNQGAATSSSTDTEADSCSFLDKLSAEIRVQIYGHVFREADHVQTGASYRCKHYNHREEGDEPTEAFVEQSFIESPIMATNKQIHGEAVDTFYNEKIIRLTFTQLDVALGALASGNSRSLDKTRYMEMARHIEIVQCKSARRDSVQRCLARLHLLPRLKSFTVLTEFLTTVGPPSEHYTAQQWAADMGLSGLVCVDIGKFDFKDDSKLAKVQLLNSKLVRMWPAVKSTPEDYDPVKEVARLRKEWAMSASVSNLYSWASHTSLRLWVAMHEALVVYAADKEAGDDTANQDLGDDHFIDWMRSTVQRGPSFTHFVNRPRGGISTHVLGPQHDPARLEAATELLAMNITSYRLHAEDLEEGFPFRITYASPSWPELGGVDIGAERSEQYRIDQAWIRENCFIDYPWYPTRRFDIEVVQDTLTGHATYGPVFGIQDMCTASNKTLQEMWYVVLALYCDVPDDSAEDEHEGEVTTDEYGINGPHYIAWATSHLRKYMRLSNHFLSAEQQFTAAEIDDASLGILSSIFTLATSLRATRIQFGEHFEPETFEMTEEMEQEENIYWPYLAQVAPSLRSFHDIVMRLAEQESGGTKQEGNQANQEGDGSNQERDEANQERDEADEETEEDQAGCVMA